MNILDNITYLCINKIMFLRHCSVIHLLMFIFMKFHASVYIIVLEVQGIDSFEEKANATSNFKGYLPDFRNILIALNSVAYNFQV